MERILLRSMRCMEPVFFKSKARVNRPPPKKSPYKPKVAETF